MFSGRRTERAWSGCRRGRAGGCELSSVPARGAGETAQRLKAQTVPTEDLRSVLRTQSSWVTVQSNCCSSSTKTQQTPWSMGPHAYLLSTKCSPILTQKTGTVNIPTKIMDIHSLRSKVSQGNCGPEHRATAKPQQLTNLTAEVVPCL